MIDWYDKKGLQKGVARCTWEPMDELQRKILATYNWITLLITIGILVWSIISFLRHTFHTLAGKNKTKKTSHDLAAAKGKGKTGKTPHATASEEEWGVQVSRGEGATVNALHLRDNARRGLDGLTDELEKAKANFHGAKEEAEGALKNLMQGGKAAKKYKLWNNNDQTRPPVMPHISSDEAFGEIGGIEYIMVNNIDTYTPCFNTGNRWIQPCVACILDEMHPLQRKLQLGCVGGDL